MAPDLSTLPRSPRPSNTTNTASSSSQVSPSISRRTSSIMAPPPPPQQNSSLPSSPRPPPAVMDATAHGTSTGPIRHPRPLTAAELHLELEKEQESIVNRLTRELSALRAQTASVASTASSTSDLFTSNHTDMHLYPYAAGITPTSARRHRSSSNLSSRSARSVRDGITNSASVTSVSGVAAPRDRDRDHSHSQSHQASSRPSMEIPRPEISRQNSMSNVYRSGSGTTNSPVWTTSQFQHHSSTGAGHQHQQSRHSVSSTYSGVGANQTGESVYHHMIRSPSSNAGVVTASRYEEAATQRAELDAVKKENEALKARIRELERSLHGGARSVSTSGSRPATSATEGNLRNGVEDES